MDKYLEDAQRKMGKLLTYLKNNQYHVVVAGSVGGIPAMAAFLSLWKILEPHRECIDAIRTASGSGIPGALASTGTSAFDIECKLPTIALRDIVEDIGFFAEHNQGQGFVGKYRDLKAYYFDGFRAASYLIHHATDYIGVVRGENLRNLLAQNLLSNNFRDTYPKLEVVATTRPQLDTFVFSAEKTPQVLISDAVTASCAIRGVFSIQYINGQGFIDAAQNDPMPVESIMRDWREMGGDVKKLFILGTFVHTFSKEGPRFINLFSEREHYDRRTHKELFRHQMNAVQHKGVPNMIFEFDSAHILLPPAEPFPEFPKMSTKLSEIRKLIALLTGRERVERFLRSVAKYIYEEMNMQHFPYYLREFEQKLYLDKMSNCKFYDKLQRCLPNFTE